SPWLLDELVAKPTDQFFVQPAQRLIRGTIAADRLHCSIRENRCNQPSGGRIILVVANPFHGRIAATDRPLNHRPDNREPNSPFAYSWKEVCRCRVVHCQRA